MVARIPRPQLYEMRACLKYQTVPLGVGPNLTCFVFRFVPVCVGVRSNWCELGGCRDVSVRACVYTLTCVRVSEGGCWCVHANVSVFVLCVHPLFLCVRAFGCACARVCVHLSVCVRARASACVCLRTCPSEAWCTFPRAGWCLSNTACAQYTQAEDGGGGTERG